MIDVKQLEDFARGCEAARQDLKPYAAKKLDEIGEEFLDIVQEEIIKHGHVVTGELFKSFEKGGAGNVYQLDAGALTLTVGTSVYYAKWVNKGHEEYERKQTPGRFIPGVWNGNKFQYIPGAKTGMVLKASIVNMPATKGSEFFEQAKKTIKKMFPEATEKAFEQFFARYF